MDLIRLLKCRSFQWDEGNSDKNWIKHQVSRLECEEIFFNRPLIMGDAAREGEARYFVLGQTNYGRRLFAVFTVRANFIRIISARPMSRRERKVYDDAQEDSEV